MNAYKQYLTINDSQQLILSNLPFSVGQKVEVIIIAEDTSSQEKRLEELRQKIAVGTEQINQGKITDGEIVFAQIQEKLQRDYGGE